MDTFDGWIKEILPNLLDKQYSIIHNFYFKYLTVNNGNKVNGQSFKYPYKPYLILTICRMIKDNEDMVKIDDKFIQCFKQYLVYDSIYAMQYLDVGEWSYSKVKNMLYKNPMAKERKPYLFIFDNQNDRIILCDEFKNYNNLKILKSLLYQLAIKRIAECTGMTIDTDIISNLPLNLNEWEATDKAIRDSRFRQLVLANSSHCLVCKDKIPLQAAHILPHATAHDDNRWNGIVLCANCHFIFDKYLRLVKEGNYYRFYIRKSLDQHTKDLLNEKVNMFTNAVNELVIKQPEYQLYFDKLAQFHQNKYL